MPQFRRPSKNEVIAALAVVLALAFYRISTLNGIIAARPEVRDTSKVAKSRDVKRGPTTTTKKKTTMPDGTKVEESTRTVAAEEVKAESLREVSHLEKPAAAIGRRRYVGIGFRAAEPRKPTLRAGMTVSGAFDMGGTFDSSRALGDALGADVTFRF